MINKKLGATHCHQLCNDERILGIKFNVDDKTFYVFNVYGPSTEDERTIFFSQLEERCRVSVEDNAQVIIAGDFNVVSSNDLDIISGNPHNAKSVDSFNATMAKLNVFDCWRLFHSDEKQYTWNRNNPFIARRLDYIFGNSSLFDKLVRSDIVPIPGTDHRGVVTESYLNDSNRGPSYWKFSEYLLHDPVYVENMNDFLDGFQDAYEGFDEQTKWDLRKIKIREMSISYSKMKAKNNKNNISKLREQLNEVDKILAQDPDNSRYISLARDIKMKLDLAAVNYCKGAQVGARIKWIEEGEKNSKYFFALEKSRSSRKTIMVTTVFAI